MKIKDNLEQLNLSESIRIPVTFASVFWLIEILEYSGGVNLNELGIYPRELKGVLGIICSPFLHGDFKHLVNNTPSFVALSTAIIAFYPRNAFKLMGLIYVSTGIGVWLFARPAYHIGASGLIYGFASFLFFNGLFRRDIRSLAISLAVAFLFNGMLYGIFPVQSGISWESHLIGACCGAVVAFIYRDILVLEEENLWKDDSNYNPVHEGYQNLESAQFRYEFKPSEKARN